MSPPLDQFIDHAAELQRSVDQLETELMFAYLSILGLTLIVAVLAYRIGRPNHA